MAEASGMISPYVAEAARRAEAQSEDEYRASRVMDVLASICRPRTWSTVYPLYLMSRVRQGIASADRERPVDLTVGELQTVGDCRYALSVTDSEGNKYRVTVECVS